MSLKKKKKNKEEEKKKKMRLQCGTVSVTDNANNY